LAVAQLSGRSLDMLADHKDFDEVLKGAQKAVLDATAAAKVARKARVSGEARRLAKQLEQAVLVKEALLKELQQKGLVDELYEDDGLLDGEGQWVPAAGVMPPFDRGPFERGEEEGGAVEAGGEGGSVGSPLEQLRYYEWNCSLLKAQHTALHLNMYFPRSEGWKMRVYIAEEDMYMGAKDVGVEKLKGSCDLRAGVDGFSIEVTDLELFTQIYQMRFKGKSSTAKALRNFMSPEMVRLGLGGSMKILANFDMAKGRWKTKKCTFDFNVNKRISGAVTVPDAVVRRLLNSILPRLVRGLVVKALPLELGPFLSRLGSDAHVALAIDVAEVIPRQVWTASLLNSTQARALLKPWLPSLDQKQVAVLLAVLSEGSALSKISGLHPAALSVDALYTYLLKFNGEESKWAALVEAWDQRLAAVSPEHTPRGWATSLLEGVKELGRKPLEAEVTIMDLDIVLNVREVVTLWSQIFLRRIKAMVKRAKDLKMPHINFKSPEKIEFAAEELVKQAVAGSLVVCSSLERAALVVDLELLGGSTLKGMLRAHHLEVNAGVPLRLDLTLPALELSLPEMGMSIEVDQESGGIHLEWIWRNPEEPSSIMCVGTVFVASLGLGLNHGRVLLTSDEVSGRFALKSRVLVDALLPEDEGVESEEAAGPLPKSPVQGPPDPPLLTSAFSTKEEVDKAVLEFVAPLLFTDSHELSVALSQLTVTALSPKDDELEIMLKATHPSGAGKVNVKLDIAKILTDVLDIVELQNRVFGQGIF